MAADGGSEVHEQAYFSGWRALWAIARPGNTLYRDAHYLAAEVEIDPRVARRLLPRPLRTTVPATATIFTAFFPWTAFGSVYREAGVLMHAEHGGVACVHSPWMIVDDDVALVAGRELLGYPKKLGEIAWRLDGDRIEAIARRRGTTLVEMRGELGEVLHHAPPILGRPHRNLACSMRPALPRLVAFTPHEEPIEVRRVDLQLKIQGSARDPLHELGVGRVLSARLHRVNLSARGVPRASSFVSPFFHLDRLAGRVL